MVFRPIFPFPFSFAFFEFFRESSIVSFDTRKGKDSKYLIKSSNNNYMAAEATTCCGISLIKVHTFATAIALGFKALTVDHCLCISAVFN